MKNYKAIIKIKKNMLLVLLLSLVAIKGFSQSLEHPIICVTEAERTELLTKINNNAWAQSIVNQLKNEVDSRVNTHQTNPNAIFSGLSDLAANDALSESAASAKNAEHGALLRIAQYSGMLYFITKEEKYAQFTSDILEHYFDKISIRTPETTAISGNYFYDPRSTYPYLAIAYDFVYDFLKKSGTKVYDRSSATYVDYNHAKAQKAIKNIAGNALGEYKGSDNRIGKTVSNHPVLTATGSLFSILMIEDDTERERMFNVFWNTGTRRQNSFTKTILPMFGEQGIWPESTSYSFMPNISLILNIVDRIKPELNITTTNIDIFNGNFIFSNLRHPNRRFVRFGDSKRDNDATAENYRYALDIATRRNLSELKQRSEVALNQNYKANGGYNPTLSNSSFENYSGLELFWGHQLPTDITDGIDFKPTVVVKHAGVALQRNYVEANNSEYGLCGIIGGAHYVHSHATGISMELYGAGYIMAANGGMPKTVPERKIPLHTDYFRLYAGNNTVIVNGTSHGRQSGSWARDAYLWQNTTVNIAAEPKHLEDPITDNISFATQLLEDRINNCDQQRTLSTIRTSPTTAYYLDVFRSKSLSENNFHDYVYHNLGDETQISHSDNETFTFTATNRYNTNIGDPVNSPGWEFFENTQVTPSTKANVNVRFDLKQNNRYMHMIMPGGVEREYTKALAPPTREASNGYINKKTQVIAVRQQGEAWDKPFINIFEPSKNTTASVKDVINIFDGDKIVGVQVISEVGSAKIIDFIISQDHALAVYDNPLSKIKFEGRFAMIRKKEIAGKTELSLYIGEGKSLSFEGEELIADSSDKGYKTVNFDGIYPEYVPIGSSPVTVQTLGETCVDKGNGKIVIEVLGNEGHKATLNGVDYDFTSNLTIENLVPGVYNLCVTKNGGSFEQCYELTIEEAESLLGKMAIVKNKVNVDIEQGSAPYSLIINDELMLTTNETHFEANVVHGDRVEVKSAAECQGLLSKKINMLEAVKAYPNPTKGRFDVYLATNKTHVNIEVYNIYSQLVSTKTYEVIGGKVHIDITNKAQGVYFVKVKEMEGVIIKVIKQ
ncbi:T9SS type A sorting domain-containing protein [Algibacter pacificus]|uniref:T9SS type A sorting domain-containing protein n=1 Tax=Algibacter pacificus TaxID=2599389 RepID=UPI0011CB6909|nr:T9SS type A sorting domain-containing protein [Algibacter pacificus]